MNVWFPESLYFVSLGYSVVLMTTSLLFYHMIKTHSLEMPLLISSLLAITLIIISIIFVIIGILSYYDRLKELQREKNKLPQLHQHILIHEIPFGYSYIALGILFMIVEFIIGFFVIVGTIKEL
jgi:uncharacterized membrane protein YidH (DUF202 family)